MGEFKQYPPYPLPRVSFTNVRLFNSISLRGTLWEFPFGTGRARLALQHAGPDFSSECTVRVTVNNAPWELLFSSQEFFRLHPILQTEGADPLSIPAELKTAMIETMVSPVLQSLQQALGAEIKITSVRLSAPPAPRVVRRTGQRALFSRVPLGCRRVRRHASRVRRVAERTGHLGYVQHPEPSAACNRRSPRSSRQRDSDHLHRVRRRMQAARRGVQLSCHGRRHSGE